MQEVLIFHGQRLRSDSQGEARILEGSKNNLFFGLQQRNARSTVHRPGHGKTRVRTVADKNSGEGWNLLGALRKEWTHVFDLWKQTAFGPETSRSHRGLH